MLSPDLKPFKMRRFIVHVGRSLGILTCCNFKIFKTCTKRPARQSSLMDSVAANAAAPPAHVSLYKFIADHTRMKGARQDNSATGESIQ
jgi:hypothetical protein